MSYNFYEVHEAEWEAMQEYLQNPEDLILGEQKKMLDKAGNICYNVIKIKEGR